MTSFSHKKKSSRGKTTEKFDDPLLDKPYSKSTSAPLDSSLQDLIKTMSNQIASLSSQFEELKQQDKAPCTSIHISRPGYECPCLSY